MAAAAVALEPVRHTTVSESGQTLIMKVAILEMIREAAWPHIDARKAAENLDIATCNLNSFKE